MHLWLKCKKTHPDLGFIIPPNSQIPTALHRFHQLVLISLRCPPAKKAFLPPVVGVAPPHGCCDGTPAARGLQGGAAAGDGEVLWLSSAGKIHQSGKGKVCSCFLLMNPLLLYICGSRLEVKQNGKNHMHMNLKWRLILGGHLVSDVSWLILFVLLESGDKHQLYLRT